MSVLYLVLPLALVVVLAAVAAFLWATNRGQFDDLDTPAVRMLHSDGDPAPTGDDSGTASGRRAELLNRTPHAPSTARHPPAPR
jgi:cbb3-type cytochrome oxidase maturation protein